MDQPVQQYPPWLTPIPSVITDAMGAPVTTVTVASYVAPTYYGPSIPLGSLYSYGGSTYPPSIAYPSAAGATTPATTTVIPTPPTTIIAPTLTPTTIVTPATPTTTPATTSISVTTTTGTTSPVVSSTTSGIITTSSATSSTLTSLTTTQSSTTRSTSVVPSVTVSPTPGISQATGLSQGQLVGIIVASILGLIFLFVLALFCFLWFKAIRKRRRYMTLTPIDDDYVVVPSDIRVPGDGSPRQSGDERDSFLRPSAVGAAGMVQFGKGMPSRPHATAQSNSSDSSNSHASGFGVLLDRPSIGFSPTIPEEYRVGQQLSSSDVERLGHEQVLPEEAEQYNDGEYAGAFAYSRDLAIPKLDPAAVPLLGSSRSQQFRQSKLSMPGEPEEDATLHTARRVKVENLGPRAGAEPEPNRRGILSAMGLGSLVNLGRKSWFKNFDSPRQSISHTYEVEPLSEKDIEAGRSAVKNEKDVDSFGTKIRGPGAGQSPDGTRPISGVSAASGNTQYHDAQSSMQEGGSTLTPPPRALTPVDTPPAKAEQIWVSSPLAGPPLYEDRPVMSTPALNTSQSSFEFPAGVDILDMPAPTALNHFASMSSLKESNSGCSFGMKPLLFPPPGLETIRAVGWMDNPTDAGSCGYFGGTVPVSPDPDVLEDAPPEAEQVWRSMATDDNHNRRGTFGTYVQGPEFTSEQGSLHSMRSHFSPSVRSTGSAPAGRFDIGSLDSNTSRPSAHSRSASSGVHSLMHKGSLSSDGRRRNGSTNHSPALSAFGHSSTRPPSRASPKADQSFESSIEPPPSVHVSPDKSITVRSIASGSTTLLDYPTRTLRGISTPPRCDSTSPLSASFQLSPPPWAGGLAKDWQPAV